MTGSNLIPFNFYQRDWVLSSVHKKAVLGVPWMLQEYSGYTFPLAVAIVLSGQYEDDLDNSEDVVYTGQGGNNLLGNKRQVQDQVMERGNLALKVCISEIWFSVLVVFLLFSLQCAYWFTGLFCF